MYVRPSNRTGSQERLTRQLLCERRHEGTICVGSVNYSFIVALVNQSFYMPRYISKFKPHDNRARSRLHPFKKTYSGLEAGVTANWGIERGLRC